MSEGIADEMSQVMELLKIDQAQLLDFLSGQMKAGTRFGGALFAMLRNAYARADSEGVRGDILQFLKSYPGGAHVVGLPHIGGHKGEHLLLQKADVSLPVPGGHAVSQFPPVITRCRTFPTWTG